MTQSDRVFHLLEAEIVSGRIPMGCKLGEAALAERFNVSRGPLREALRRLEGRSLVVRLAHAGTRVISLSEGDMIDLYEVRKSLEGLSARLAAANRTEQDLEDLSRLLAGSAELAEDDREYHQGVETNDFHYRIALASKSRQLRALLCGELYSLIRMCRFRTWSLPGQRRAHEDHKRILEAIEERDGDLADLLMQRHVSLARARFSSARQNDISEAATSPATLQESH